MSKKKTSEAEAVAKVSAHVSPKACFIWDAGGEGWVPIPGTGCAHWVAHEKGWALGKHGSNGCKLGYLIRVTDLVAKANLTEVKEPSTVEVGCVFINDAQDHCGIVRKVVAAKEKGKPPTIDIEHCSSGQGKVATNDWGTYFKGKGKFYTK